MSFLDLFRKKSDPSGLRKHAQRAAKKRGVQAVDRWESIQALVALGTPEAIRALLPRFTFYVDPSITDQEEKNAAFEGIVRAGDVALEPVTEFLQQADSISWPVKMLERLASREVVTGKLVELLGGMDTEYERDPQRKIQILATFEDRKDERIVDACTRFLEDANETVRFHAVGALFAQDNTERAKGPLLDCFVAEDSVRIRSRILDGFIERNWNVADRKNEVQPLLPAGYALDAKAHPRKT